MRDQLFGPDVNPAGQVIRIQNQPFTVAGVMASKGQSSVGQDQDDVVFVPYTTVMKKLKGVTFIQNVTVSAASAGETTRVADSIATMLRVRHKSSRAIRMISWFVPWKRWRASGKKRRRR